MNSIKAKIAGLALAASLLCTPISASVYAETVGEVVNHTLYTDIIAYIDGQPIESYNINGRTAIVAEQLLNYGFGVEWNAEDRSLSVTDTGKGFTKRDITLLSIPKAMIGQRKSEVYYTDITTYIDGTPVESYNVGGSTIIIFDSLSVYGNISWDDEKREISFTRRLTPEEQAEEIIRLVNLEREKEGCQALKKSENLMSAAGLRAEEISRDGQFSHTRPDGSRFYTALDELGVLNEFYSYGENIAMGYRTAESVMDGWMNSEGHRRNILNSQFNTIGVGVYKKDGTYYWVQIFGTEASNSVSAVYDDPNAEIIPIG